MIEIKRSVYQICMSSSWGGQEMVALETAELFQKNVKINSILITVTGSELESRAQRKNLKVITFKKQKYFHPEMSFKIREIAKKDHQAVFMSHQLPDLWMISVALWGLSNRLIGFSHTFVNYNKRSLVYKWIYSRVDRFIVLTEKHLINFLDHHAVQKNKISIIPNSVDTKKFSPQKKSSIFESKYNAKSQDIKIVVVGRLDPEKGQIEVVQSAAQILKLRTDFQIYIIGTDTFNSPGTEKKLKEEIKSQHLENHVYLLGHCENVPELLASADFKIMPSYAETFGRVIIEAMACGCPVLATDSGGVSSIIQDGHNGLLCKPKDTSFMAEKILELINNKELRQKLSDQGLVSVYQLYDQDLVTSQIYGLLN